MDWYYSQNGTRCGPVKESELPGLLAAGTIKAETLVWNETLKDWQPAKDVPALIQVTGSPASDLRKCIVTGREFPVAQMIQTDQGWVSFEGKDTYYQCLREGIALPTPAGQFNARADGKRVVVPLKDPTLPLRCVKTNQPAEPGTKERKLYWSSPWIWLTIVISLLVVLILVLVTRKKLLIKIPLSAAGRHQLRQHQLKAAGLFALGFLVIFTGAFITSSGAMIGGIVVGAVMLIASLIYATTKGTALRMVKVRDGEAWLAGAGPEFIASLPVYR